MPHRTPCTYSAHDRARRFLTHRTPCIACANDRADKRCTPCTSSEASPRARTGRSASGLSAASCPLVSNSSSGTSAFVGGALFRFVPFVVNSSLRFSSTLAPSISGTAILTLGRHTVVVILPSRPHKVPSIRKLTTSIRKLASVPTHRALRFHRRLGSAGFTRDSSSATDTAVQDRRSPPVDPPRAVLVSRSTFPKRPLVGSEVRT